MCSSSSQLEELRLHVNELVGELPERIGECSALRLVSMSYNKISGVIPRGIGNLTTLQILYVGYNNLIGTIPEEMGNLDNLNTHYLGVNNLRGSIPTKIFNISNLQIFTASMNQLSGQIPSSFGYGLPNLVELYVNDNYFTGQIPHSITNSSKLTVINFSTNNLSGLVPNILGGLSLLEELYLDGNNFVSESSELSFINSLTNCRYLRKLSLGNNHFNGILPVSVGNLSTYLEYFYAYNCRLRGTIPDGFGNLVNLLILSLFDNRLTGSIPTTFGNLQNLQGLALYTNSISGFIPNNICGLQRLNGLFLQQNQVTGSIPDCIGNLTTLRSLKLGNNKLDSRIPTNLWQLNDLLELNLSSNFLIGSLPPDAGNLKVATLSIGKLVNLETLDLSHNNLSGNIPKSLEGLRYLTYFDVSFNYLSGQIPSGGPFRNFGSQFFASNEGLCGDLRYGVPKCRNAASQKRNIILRVVYALLGVSALVFVMAIAYVFRRYRKKETVESQRDLTSGKAPLRASYYELSQATEGFNESHLLGTGGFSSVYKGTLQNEEEVAIKVFNLQLERAFKSFDTECEVLRNLRHRNLCKVITACSNENFKALILEYMPNGSLERWLYSEDYFLDMMQRIDIMMDVACALEYLHHGYTIPIVHCDLKPSNVLLDQDMVGHLSDFGIAKVLGDDDSFAQTTTIATFGYIAPEYGSEGLVSIRCDVYSYGIMLMEVFTRRKPSSEAFPEDLSLRSWVTSSFPNAITRIIDPELLKLDEENFAGKYEILSSIMELALKCSMENPDDRINMEDVVAALKKIKLKLLPYFPETTKGSVQNNPN
ncbi:hypothetical protein BUALT_Bualt16G0054100 [Buddleja alternifolia]|uniref:non-specific serine/threonine protein kinase n=1 Tax=Buddleja alternifolia TaxID=168488 RepID=A0AAV6WH32_9LAMI|nr:hypothetical protein BUALT_Bualt16G0054100 [Buddleja alternifolia]